MKTYECKKYIVVTGGQLSNKGAQAMVFITVDEVAKRYPDRKVVILSNKDLLRSQTEKQNYKFDISGYPKLYWLFLMQTRIGRVVAGLLGGQPVREYTELMRNAEAVVDVSGYALGSDWGYKKSCFYLARLKIAKIFDVPVYLMPQSFGPFDYRGVCAPFMRALLRKNLRYPKVVLCREQEGYDLLCHKYGIRNAHLSPDLVLQNRGIDCQHIYHKVPNLTTTEVPNASVAVIPNKKTIQYGDAEQMSALYRQIVEVLLKQGKTVFLISHSAKDRSICRQIKEQNFQQTDSVCVVENELSCLEFDALVGRFDFVVASRFHAIVHAYRNAVPALVLGWAVKYRELLADFSQEAYQFDVRGELDITRIVEAVREMCLNHEQIAAMIQSRLQEIQKESVYDYLKLETE